jgi:hypothetical protein
MYLIPPNMPAAGLEDPRNWIRIRQVDGLFFIHFYNEVAWRWRGHTWGCGC